MCSNVSSYVNLGLSIYDAVLKESSGTSFRLGLRGLALGLALLVAFDASAGNSAAHGEGEVAAPKTGNKYRNETVTTIIPNYISIQQDWAVIQHLLSNISGSVL